MEYIDTRFNNDRIGITEGEWWYHESCAQRSRHKGWRPLTERDYSISEVSRICCKGCWDSRSDDTKFNPATTSGNTESMHFL